MGIKVFMEQNGLEYDELCVPVHASRRAEIEHWCKDRNIPVDPNFYHEPKLYNIDLWRVDNAHERMLFALRWA